VRKNESGNQPSAVSRQEKQNEQTAFVRQIEALTEAATPIGFQ